MKNRILILIGLILVAFSSLANAATFYRVIADISFEKLDDAITCMNSIEKVKTDVYTEKTLEGNESYAKLVGSYDSSVTNAPEYTMIDVDFSVDAVTWKASEFETTATQEDLDKKQKYIDKQQAKLDALQATIDAASAELASKE